MEHALDFLTVWFLMVVVLAIAAGLADLIDRFSRGGK